MKYSIKLGFGYLGFIRRVSYCKDKSDEFYYLNFKPDVTLDFRVFFFIGKMLLLKYNIKSYSLIFFKYSIDICKVMPKEYIEKEMQILESKKRGYTGYNKKEIPTIFINPLLILGKYVQSKSKQAE